MIDEKIIFKSFTTKDNHTFHDILKYLNIFQKEYFLLYDENRRMLNKSKIDDSIILKYEKEILNLNKKIKEEQDKNMYLICKLNKKLTIFERLTGKIKN
jgi:hypothetical protein